MKKYLMAILPLALLAAGCEDPCDKGISLRNDEALLEATFYETLLTPSQLPALCYSVGKSWNKKLTNGAMFADKMADEHFYSESRRCVSGHEETRCRRTWDRYPSPGEPYRPYPPYLYCRKVFVCDDIKVTPHKKDGYEQAIETARLLRVTKNQVGDACVANASGDTVSALANLAMAKSTLTNAQSNTDYVLTKAGCYNRAGN